MKLGVTIVELHGEFELTVKMNELGDATVFMMFE
jgi:hypothetical protein